MDNNGMRNYYNKKIEISQRKINLMATALNVFMNHVREDSKKIPAAHSTQYICQSAKAIADEWDILNEYREQLTKYINREFNEKLNLGGEHE